ncbi:kinesin-like protein KIN-14C [Nymphaea colorata]|uniref:kinesin-like protein KIN-14C n=1 Tax=Nymphaea colorata TaxID=210225 RepID=UPI00129DDA97|nr:kinesin-like protein KIN-14C [Nymphaea colorata]
MNPQVMKAAILGLNTSVEDGEFGISRAGNPRSCSPRVVSPKVVSPRIGSPRLVANASFLEPAASRRYANAVMGTNARQRAEVVEWLNGMFHSLRIPADASEEDLRRRLVDGTVLCGLMKKLNPGTASEVDANEEPEFPRSAAAVSAKQRSENVKKFLLALDELGLPTFEPADLEQGPIPAVIECLLSLKDHYASDAKGRGQQQRKAGSELEGSLVENSALKDQSNGQTLIPNGEEKQKNYADSKFQNILKGPAISETVPSWPHAAQKSDVFQPNEGSPSEVKVPGMMNLNGLDNAPTQSLLGVVNAILGEKQNGEVPPRIEMLLRKVMQEIERRMSTQGEHIKKLKLALREVLAREERLVSRAGVLETLATGTSEEIKIVTDQLQKIKTEKDSMEEKRKLEEQDVVRLMKEKEEIENAISHLNQELETTRKAYEQRCLNLETQGKEAVHELEEKVKQLGCSLEESKRKSEELEALSELKSQNWKSKELGYKQFVDNQLQALGDLKLSSQAAKNEILDARRGWLEEINKIGVNLKGLAEAAKNYQLVLDENRKLYNEVQDLKGNIRVYCRVRPFLPGEARKQSIVEYVGEDGELLVSNPAKPGKDGQRMFKFNKVYGQTATQVDVFKDTQPLIRSILDGFNVCIFAYGQTGSGKTYTMTGPDPPTEETWGVNYRALNDLFLISQKRKTTYAYEVGVQMVEIYNEQIRDLLSNDGSQKKLGIASISQNNGLSVPDATMRPVESTADVIALMDMGQMNRAVSSTAMNERSSRSHSVLTVHVRGTNLETGATIRGSLHLVDLAGSERVERSEAVGDRLKEAQHINKSLSALGDVIYALASKSPHIPYRNSKLTQILQTSLGGQAKTLMFVQLNPDPVSYSESMSTLKFAERVSGVELGAAKSNKESKEVRDLMEQVAQLKELVSRKDAEIERLQLLKDQRPRPPEINTEKRSTISPKVTSPLSPNRSSLGVSANQSRRSSTGKVSRVPSSSALADATKGHRKAVSDLDNYSEYSNGDLEGSSLQHYDDIKHQKGHSREAKQGETDGSSSIVELTLFPEAAKSPNTTEKKPRVPVRATPRPSTKTVQPVSARPQSGTKDSSKPTTTLRKTTVSQSSASTVKSSKRWQGR